MKAASVNKRLDINCRLSIAWINPKLKQVD